MTRLADMPKITTTNHTAQVTWLENQFKKCNDSVFMKKETAQKAWNKILDENLGLPVNREIEKFMAKYLNKTGVKALTNTLRVAETRAKKKGFKLQCNIKVSNNRKLEEMMNATGLTKGAVLDKLIELANLEKITKTEEQLEITL